MTAATASRLRIVVALAVAALGGGVVALVGAGVAGVGGTTTVREVQSTATAPAAVSATASGGLDAPALWSSEHGSVVTVETRMAGGTFAGTGFVVDAKGEIATAAHVVTTSSTADAAAAVVPADEIRVRFADGDDAAATLVGYDLVTDVALLRVEKGRRTLSPVAFGDPATLRIGDPVAIIGSPFGDRLEGSLSVGVVSGLARALAVPLLPYRTPDGIQTDAAINHGTSGAPLFDASGRVVGLTVQAGQDADGSAGDGVGFAVGSDLVQRSLAQLRADGKAAWPWLGAGLREVTPAMATALHIAAPRGLLVNSIQTGGAAAAAGLQAGSALATWGTTQTQFHPDGDVIVGIDRKPVTTNVGLDAALYRHRPGDRVELDVVRGDGTRERIAVVLQTRPLDPRS